MPEDPDNTDPEQPEDNAVIRDLRQKAGRAEAAESKAQELERENVVLRAGLNDLTGKQLKALAAAHEGDWEPEALKVTANELGFAKPEATGDEPKVPQEELDTMRRVQQAGGGDPPPPPDLEARLQNATSQQEVIDILGNAGMIAQS